MKLSQTKRIFQNEIWGDNFINGKFIIHAYLSRL